MNNKNKNLYNNKIERPKEMRVLILLNNKMY